MQHHLVDSPGPGPVDTLAAEGRGIGRLSLSHHDCLLHAAGKGIFPYETRLDTGKKTDWSKVRVDRPTPGCSGFVRNSSHTGAGILCHLIFANLGRRGQGLRKERREEGPFVISIGQRSRRARSAQNISAAIYAILRHKVVGWLTDPFAVGGVVVGGDFVFCCYKY